MKAGIISSCKGKFGELSSFHTTDEQDGKTFSRSLQILNTDQLQDGTSIFWGEAAIEIIEENTNISIDEETGDIAVVESPDQKSKYTEFLIAEDEFAAVRSSNGIFAFELLREASPTISVKEFILNLNSFADDYYTGDNVNPWKVGFYGNIGSAEKGTIYGDDVFSDSEIGDVLERSQLNQLGLEYDYNGNNIKMTATESGYVEIYQPSNYTTTEYAEYVVDHIIPYLEGE